MVKPIKYSLCMGWVGLFCCLFNVISLEAAVKIKLSGNDYIGTGKIEEYISPPDTNEVRSEDDWETYVEEVGSEITDIYADYGFFEVAIHVSREGTEKPWESASPVLVKIIEGEHYRYGPIVLVALDGSALRIEADELRCQKDRYYKREEVFSDKRDISRAYANKGFPYAKVIDKIALDTVTKQVLVEFSINPGRAVVFDTLVIHNLRENDSLSNTVGITQAQRFHRLLPFTKGDTVNYSELDKYEKKLKSTRVFNFFRVKDSATQNEQSALIIHSEERTPGEVDASIFYETQYGPGFGGNWIHSNIDGSFHEVRLGASFAQMKQSFGIGYASALLFGSTIRFDNDLITNWYQASVLQKEARAYAGDFDISNQTKLSRTFNRWSRFLSTAEFKGTSIKSIDTTGAQKYTVRVRNFNLNYINSVFFAFLDDPVNPTRGERWSITWGNGGPFFEKDDFRLLEYRHNWLEWESAFYWPLWEGFKVAFRLDGGRFFTGSTGNADRFFQGGSRSVRSYGWRELCPEKIDDVCNPVGLRPAYFLTSFELRLNPFIPIPFAADSKFKFLKGLQIVPFIDYGNVWDIGHNLKVEGKGRAYGLGFRYSLFSIFNLRVDYAQDNWQADHYQWYLDLAQAF